MSKVYAVTMWVTHIFIMLGDLLVSAAILGGLYLIFFGHLTFLGTLVMVGGIAAAGLGLVHGRGGPFFAWKPSAFRALQQHLSAQTAPVPVESNNTRNHRS